MPVVHRTAPAVAALASVLVLAGCGSSASTAPEAGSGKARATAAGGSPCPSATELSARGLYDPADGTRLPEDFEAQELVRCTLETREYAGEGLWSVVVERRASAGLQPLVSALRAPSDTSTPGFCDDVGHSVPWMALRGSAGTWTHPAVPATACRAPQPGYALALDGVALTEVAVTRVAQVQTPAEVDLEQRATALGCTTTFKDLLAMYDQDRRGLTAPTRSGPVVVPATAPLAVCRMRAEPDPEEPLLRFVSGERRTGAAATALAAALAASDAPAATCTSAAASQVVISPGNGGFVVVELDGCHRVLASQSHETLTQASPALLAALR